MNKQTKIGWSLGILLVIIIAGIAIWQRGDRPSYPELNSPRPYRGQVGAAVVVEEFSDFQCPACKSARPVADEAATTFGDRIVFYYRHFPLTSIHPYAFRAALAVECANDQGKFWDYHDQLFDHQPNFSEDDLIRYAGDLELNVDSFTACLKSRAKNDVVRADIREGDSRRVQGTPTFFINGERVADWSKLKEIIQAKLLGG